MALDHRGDHGLTGRSVSEVDRVGPCPWEAGGDLIGPGTIAVRDHDGRPSCRQRHRDGGPDTACPTGDEGDPLGQAADSAMALNG